MRTVVSAAASRAESSSAVASRLRTSSRPLIASALKTSEPRFTHRNRRPGPAGLAWSCPSTFPTCVPVTTPRSKPRAHSSSTSSRKAPASALRSGTAVPSQSKTTASKRRSSSAGRRRLRFTSACCRAAALSTELRGRRMAIYRDFGHLDRCRIADQFRGSQYLDFHSPFRRPLLVARRRTRGDPDALLLA